MLTSSTKQFIFVHVQKTAGTCLARTLEEQVPDARPLGFKHDGARDAISLVGREAWDKSFTFSFVRNPWDRQVSWWSMIDQHRPRFPFCYTKKRQRTHPRLWQYAMDNARTFEEFVLRCTDEIQDEHFGVKSFVRTQSDYLLDPSGQPCVDFVGRFESLEKDFNEIGHRLGIALSPLARVKNPSKHKHYSLYYTDHTRSVVADRFAEDIERFGYAFEDRRND